MAHYGHNEPYIEVKLMATFWSVFNWITGTGLFEWVANHGFKWSSEQRDRYEVYEWLKTNTRDEPAESHKSLFEISDGARLPEERVQVACLKDLRIHQSLNKPGNYSIWRKEPQSVYEKRGIVAVGDPV
jgi:hypothetical protein